MMPLLEVQNLIKNYADVSAVADVSFVINRGQCFGLLGPNGAGKTTTIEMMEGITEPTSGRIFYKGEPLGQTFRRECGIQFQSTALQEFLTVQETLQLFQGLYPESVDLDDLIQRCNLGEFLHNDNRKLSGGQRQRLLLAIALVNNPELVFLDEPTTGLDPQSRHNFWKLIREVLSHGTTVILSTHYMEEAAELCDEIIIMDHGRIIAQGGPSELLQSHFSERLVRIPDSCISEALKQSLLKQQFKLFHHNGWVEILTSDISQAMALFLEAGVDLSFLQVRQRNLEDLFLELTGHELRV